MDRFVKNIAERYVEQLPEKQETYKLIDLQQNGFPKFVVKRIKVELERNLAESIILPQTDWADMESEAVRHAWEQFVSAIRSKARLPRSYTYPIVETAISDILEILVQPRKNLPDIVFGADDTLSRDEVNKRMEAVVVYRHFASLIPRYMEKKGIDELSKERASNVINQTDEKLISHYTPLNWAQMLEPLFVLLEGQIDSNLLRLFYEDKNIPALARRFDLMDRSLNRSELIELLSSPDLLDEEEQNDLFGGKRYTPEQSGNPGELEEFVKPGKESQLEDDAEVEKMPGDEHSKEDTTKEEEISNTGNNDLNTLYGLEDEKIEETEEKKSPESSLLNDVFDEEEESEEILTISEDEEPEPVVEKEIDDELEEKDGEVNSTEEISSEEESKSDLAERETGKGEHSIQDFEQEDNTFNTNFEPHEEVEPTPAPSKEVEEGEPMWRRFVSPGEENQGENSEEFGEEEETEAADEDDFIEEPIIDLTREEDPTEEEMDRLEELLRDDRERFVNDIFRGGEEAYEQALLEIASKDSWQEASKFIHKDIFKRNLVDMYSEAAVDFTDRLHSFFTETTKSN